MQIYQVTPWAVFDWAWGWNSYSSEEKKKKKQLKIALNEINFSTAWKVQAQSILWIIQC